MRNKLLITTALITMLSIGQTYAYTITENTDLNTIFENGTAGEEIWSMSGFEGTLTTNDINISSSAASPILYATGNDSTIILGSNDTNNLEIASTTAKGTAIFATKNGKIELQGKTVLISSPSRTVFASGSHKDNSSGKITVTGKTIDITGSKDYGVAAVERSFIDLTASERINIDAEYSGVHVQSNSQPKDNRTEFSTINITAPEINISGGTNAVVAMSQGILNIEGNTSLKGESAIVARGDAVVNINKSGEHRVKMEGNIDFDHDADTSGTNVDATLNVILNGEDSYWTGNTISNYNSTTPYDENDKKFKVSNATIDLNNGAKWNATEVQKFEELNSKGKYEGSHYVALNNLNINNGTVNILRQDGISIDNLNAKDASFDGGILNINDTMNVSGVLTLNNEGITGDNATINFADGSSLKTALSEEIPEKSIISAKTISGTTAMVFETGSNGGMIKFTGDQSGFNFADNILFNVEQKEGVYTFTKKSTADLATAVNATENHANALVALTSGTSDNETFNTIAHSVNDILQSGDKTKITSALDVATTLSPEIAPMVHHTQTETVNQVFSAVSSRLSGGSVSSGSQGLSSGDNGIESGAVWLKGLYNHAKLEDDTTHNVKGFTADSYGVAFGIEKFVTDTVKAGLGYAYTDTDISGFRRDTDAYTHTAFIYGEYKPSAWFINTTASYNWSDYKEKKSVLNHEVKGNYDADTLALQAVGGYDFIINGYTLTPETGLRYIHISQDGYTDSLGTRVSGNDSDILTGIIGARISRYFSLNNINFRPELRVAATYDLKNDDASAWSMLANGASYQVRGEELKRFAVELGAGLTAELSDSFEVTASYEGRFRQNYYDNTGMLSAKYKF